MLLEVKDLCVDFMIGKKTVRALKHLDFEVREGEILGIVGESGCGKSLTALAIMDLLPGNAFLSGGSIVFDQKRISGCTEAAMCKIRGREIAMIFQHPMSSFDPTMSIGRQLTETFKLHRRMREEEAKKESIHLLEDLKLPSPEARMKEYPHQFSGGMLQRIAIAMAMAPSPRLIIADEPTTALDSTIQYSILNSFLRRRRENHTSIILITHDMGVVSNMADRILVLYAGELVESGRTEDIIKDPKHPYTGDLIAAVPDINKERSVLKNIPGNVPPIGYDQSFCAYYERCAFGFARCAAARPPIYGMHGREIRCFKYEGNEKRWIRQL